MTMRNVRHEGIGEEERWGSGHSGGGTCFEFAGRIQTICRFILHWMQEERVTLTVP